MRKAVATLLAGLIVALPLPTTAAGPVKIGMITTLTGPGGFLGEDARDSFMLAVEQEGGKLGGIPVEVTIQDDGLKPGNAKEIARRYIEGEEIKILTGIIFSNVLTAVLPDVVQANALYLSNMAAPAHFAGKGCHPNFFVVGWQNDTLHESAGINATRDGHKRAFILAPNYPAGADALNGFKRGFKGQIVGEINSSLTQTDFSPEIAQIRAAKPDAVYAFQPGGLGITFLRQYTQANLGNIPVYAIMDTRTLFAVSGSAKNLRISGAWNADFPNAANKQYVAAFQKRYNRLPTLYGAVGYDTARLLGSALRAVNGDVSKMDELKQALRKADFASVRGTIKFNRNQHAIQDYYDLPIVFEGGAPVLKTGTKVASMLGDAYAQECKM